MSTSPDAASQLVFDLPHRPAMGRADFLVTHSNEAAVAWIDKWPDWPTPALIIHGPRASGKTHLSHVWQVSSQAVFLNMDTTDIGNLDARTVVIDAADQVAGHPGAEQKLLHLYNLLQEKGGHMLLLAEKPVAQWGLALPDLESRLKASASAGIALPDDLLLSAVLVKLFADRQLRISKDVITYLLPRMSRSLASAHQLVEAVDAYALAQKKPVTVSLVRTVLQQL